MGEVFGVVACGVIVVLVIILSWMFNFAQIWITWTIARGMFCTAVPETNLFLIAFLAFWIMIIDTILRVISKLLENK